MYRGLIDNLTFVYTYICKGRGKMSAADMRAIAEGAHTLTRNAPAVLSDGAVESWDDRADLVESRKIDEHIEEMVAFLVGMEIV